MNSEIIKLQQEINKLRKQNLEKQKQIKYIPLNIISNNLYINNSTNNKSLSKNNSNKNSRYNSFINKKKNPNDTSSSFNYNAKKNKSYGKLPFKKGMFSYKNSLMTSTPMNYQNNNISYNRFNYKGSNNNSLLSANLKLNLENDDNFNNNNLSPHIVNHGRVASSSSLDLNKYKITDKNISNLLNSNRKRKVSAPNIQSNDSIRKVHTNYFINNIFQKKINVNNRKSLINNKNNLERKKSVPSYHNSMEMLKISPIIPKMSNKEQNSQSVLGLDDYKDSSHLLSNKHSKKRKIFDHYVNNPKNEKESRRMIIELVKVLNRQNHLYNNNPIYMHGDVDAILEKNNISKKVLNKEYILPKEFNSSSLFHNTIINKNNRTFGDINLNKSSLSSSMINNFNDSVMNLNNKVLSKNFPSPIKSNINNFLISMNDEKKDKINMINFLSVPRIMDLYFLNNKYKYICFLCPNNICYINGIESYIFKLVDVRRYKLMGGFDLIKVNYCSVNNNNQNNFYIETYDGKTHRNYEFGTSSKDIASQYVKSINYLAQLEKCKIYNYNNINQ